MAAQDRLDAIKRILDTIEDVPHEDSAYLRASYFVHIGQALGRTLIQKAMSVETCTTPTATETIVMAAIMTLPDPQGFDRGSIADYTHSDFVESGRAALRGAILDALASEPVPALANAGLAT